MKLVCPICQGEFPLQAAINDVAAREAIVAAFGLHDLGSLLICYVGLFKPAKRTAISMPRLTSLLKELVPMVKEGQITRGGTLYPAPRDYWQQGIEAILQKRDTLKLPLKSHGYLLEIIASFTHKANAQAETQAEQGRQYGQIKNAIPNAIAASTGFVKASHIKKQKTEAPEGWRATIKKGNNDESRN